MVIARGILKKKLSLCPADGATLGEGSFLLCFILPWLSFVPYFLHQCRRNLVEFFASAITLD
jgi:hypothetical protein